ncbi:MAG: VWA domain-containing protein [Ignavibacteria bacterium]|nr:VWA domain-containing protein [Ignavibacteria bacterium]
MKTIILALILLSFTTPIVVFGNGLVEARTSKGSNLISAKETRVDTRIREQVAITLTTQTFELTDTMTTNLRYGFPVPPSLTVTGIRYRIGTTWRSAVMRTSDTAITNPVGGGGSSPTSRFLDAVGVSGFVFPLRDTLRNVNEITFELTAVELLPYSQGRVTYLYPLNTLRSMGINNIVWTLDVQTSRPMTDVAIGPAVVERERTDTTLRTANGMTSTSKDILVSYDQAVDSLAVTMMSAKPEGSDGYALLLAVPNLQGTNNILPKRFTFVIDRSGSMGTTQMEQAKQAAIYCLERVSPFDEVNVVDFDDIITPLYSKPRLATPQTIKECVDRIRWLSSRGGTEITKALATTFGTYQDSANVNVIVFLTDGISAIDFQLLRARNTFGTRIFVFGVGAGVNETDLRRLASEHRGEMEVIRNPGSVTARIGALYERIKDPIVKNPQLTFAPDVMYDFAPVSIPDIYAGEQLVVAGRYRQPGPVTVTLSGSNVKGQLTNTFVVNLVADDTTAPFVPKIWARLRINALIELMSRVAASSALWREYRDEIIRLGSVFGLITPYTTYEQGPSDDGGGTTGVVANDGPVAPVPLGIWPNPASALTRLGAYFDLAHANVIVTVTDMMGKVLLRLHLGAIDAGQWNYDLSVLDENGLPLGSGSYVVTLTADTESFTSILRVIR